MEVKQDKTKPCRAYKDLASFISSMPLMIPVCMLLQIQCRYEQVHIFVHISYSFRASGSAPSVISICAKRGSLQLRSHCCIVTRLPASLTASLDGFSFVRVSLSLCPLRPLIATSWSQQRRFSKYNMPPDASR